MSTTATSPSRIFLLPPDSSGALAPPKVNEGAGASEVEDVASSVPDDAVLAAISLSAVPELTVVSAAEAGCASRAGAGALAAPLPAHRAGGVEGAGKAAAAGFEIGFNSAEIAGAAGAENTGVGADGKFAAAGALAATFFATGGTGTGALLRLTALAAGAKLGLAATGACAGIAAGLGAGVAGRGVGGVGVVAIGAAGFPASPFLSNPRATRRVPLACSTLMGLVRTRLAPMRKAFATPT